MDFRASAAFIIDTLGDGNTTKSGVTARSGKEQYKLRPNHFVEEGLLGLVAGVVVA